MKLRYWGALLLGVVGGAVVIYAALPHGSRTVTLFQWEDYMNQPFLADYEKRFGEKPNIAMFADEDDAFAQDQREAEGEEELVVMPRRVEPAHAEILNEQPEERDSNRGNQQPKPEIA